MTANEQAQRLSNASHITVIHTYGSQRVKHPRTGQTISAYKLGYTSAARAVLLARGLRARVDLAMIIAHVDLTKHGSG